MRLLNIKNIKTIAALGTMVFFMSCTNELATINGGLIDNDNFVKDTINLTPTLATVNIDTVRTNLMTTYLLGEYTDAKLGTLKSTIVGQLVPDTYPLIRTTADPESDVVSSEIEVELQLPLTLVNIDDSTEEFEIDNLVGDVTGGLDITVSTFTTYLELQNEDATTRIYYSDGTNNVGTKQDLGTETLLGTLTDVTVLDVYTEADSLSYSINIPLDSDYFETKLNHLDTLDVTNGEEFRLFFKGLKIEATKNGEGYAIPFDLSNASLKITYKNENTVLETEEERTLTFSFQGAVYNTYNHDHSNSNETDKTYVQGAGGYETSIDLSDFVSSYAIASQDENWLINQAKIKVYLDDIEDQTLQSFYLYGINSDDSLTVVDDYITLGVGGVNGVVTYEDLENETNPYMEFYITDFIKAALADGEIAELRIKARESSENTSIVLSSSIPNGALLLNDQASDKAPTLEVIYSKID